MAVNRIKKTRLISIAETVSISIASAESIASALCLPNSWLIQIGAKLRSTSGGDGQTGDGKNDRKQEAL